MDPVNSSDIPAFSNAQNRVDKSAGFLPKSSSSVPAGSISNSLPDIAKLANDATQSGKDVRPEAISRAQKLLQDPNWLSDYNIDGLADKLLDVENI